MHKNKIWLGFLVVMSLTVLWFTWGAAVKLYNYIQYQERTSAQNVRWSMIRYGDNDYQLRAKYSFRHEGNRHNGEIVIDRPIYQNPWAAEQAVTMNTAKPWNVWYSGKNPKHSTIIKKFPMKETISTAILWGLLAYFVWLGVYVTRFRR